MTEEYQIISIPFRAQLIEVYEEPNPRIKELEEQVTKIREVQKSLEKMIQDLTNVRYQIENEITNLMYT